MTRKMNDEIVCPVCGCTFPLANANQRYCSPDCKRAAKRAAEAARAQRMRERAEHPKSTGLSPLSMIAREANAAGMTYGRYVAQKTFCEILKRAERKHTPANEKRGTECLTLNDEVIK